MTEYESAIIDVANRFARAAEQLVEALAKGAAASAKTKAGKKKKDALTVRGPMTKFNGPNKHGFFDCTVAGNKYSTKSTTIAEILDAAWQADGHVELSYVERVNGQYTNRYIESAEIVTSTMVSEGGKQRPEMPPDEDAGPTEETPF